MTGEPNLTKFQQKLAERRAQQAAESASVEHTFDNDLIPESSDGFERSDADVEMDRVIESIDIIDAYNRWCGKMRPEVKTGQREGIKISCPNPSHPDKDPSAWINLDKQTWYCGGCAEGGDTHDIAAWHFGFQVPAYKDGAQFHELRRKMAQDFGFHITRLAGGAVVVTPPAEEGEDDSTESEVPAEAPKESAADVVDLFDDGDIEIDLPGLDWQPIVPEDTFLWEYMNAVAVDDVPEEYHFFHALIALGFALGRDVRLADSPPVYGNLYACLLGKSGAGKSKAARHLKRVLADALPYDSDPINKGVKVIQSPSSGEVLVYNFQKPVEDPTNPKKIAYFAPVRGLVQFSELADLTARSERQGSTIKPTLMSIYDCDDRVETSSMTTGAKVAEMPFGSALSTTQPKALREVINKRDAASGFLNRWVFIPGTYKQRFAVGGVVVDMKPATEVLKQIKGWAASFGTDEMVTWTPEALELYTEFFRRRIEVDEGKADILGRMSLTVKKLVLLFTANRGLREVPKESVEDAMYCYDYLVKSYGVLEDQVSVTLGSEVAEALMYQAMRYYEKHKKGATIRELTRPLQRRKYPIEMVKKTLDALVALERLTVETSKTGQVGRPTVRYKYVD